MGIALQVHPWFKQMFINDWHFIAKASVLFISITIAGIVFILTSRVLKMDEYENTFAKIINRMTKKLGLKK